jgi:hypothetical protein
MREIAILLGMVVRGLPELVLRPWDFPFFWLLVGLVAMQYRRVAENERRLYGVPKNQVLWQVVAACLFGLAGGLVASLMMAAVGVSLSGAGVTWLLPLALFLMAINPRLMCFSYAGGLVSFSYLLFGWPRIHVPSIMALVAILHLTESLLIFLRGAACTTPVTVHNASRNTVRTGFLMQGFWPLPLLLLFVVTLPAGAPREGLIEMPNWWPLIVPPPEIAAQENAVFTLFPVAAVLGYSDLAARWDPDRKARRSSLMLAAYSVVLLALSVWGSRSAPGVWLAALWGPLAHEAVVRLGSKGEFESRPALERAPDGITVLDVLPNSGAARAGVRSGDVIVHANGRPTPDGDALAAILGQAGAGPLPLGLRRGLRRVDVEAQLGPLEPGGSAALGVIPLPDEATAPQMEVLNRGYLATLFSRIRERWRGR